MLAPSQYMMASSAIPVAFTSSCTSVASGRAGDVAAEWGVSENNRQAKYYRLTRTGKRQLGREQENWKRLAEAVGRILATES